MTVLNDKQIRKCVSIKPFTDPKVRDGLSYGLGSFGYDVRASNEFKIFTNVNTVGVDPKAFDEKCFVSVKTDDPIWIPPNSFILCSTVEYVTVPDDCTVIVLGKSTYARCGVVCIATPLESGWYGNVVLEFANTTPLPVKFYPNEGCAQLVFFRGERPEKTYAELGGKYQGQVGVTLPKVVLQQDIVLKALSASPITEKAVLAIMAKTDRSGEILKPAKVKPTPAKKEKLPFDPEAPYGRKIDGTPKKKVGRMAGGKNAPKEPSKPVAPAEIAPEQQPVKSVALASTAALLQKDKPVVPEKKNYKGTPVLLADPAAEDGTVELRAGSLPKPGKPPSEIMAAARTEATRVINKGTWLPKNNCILLEPDGHSWDASKQVVYQVLPDSVNPWELMSFTESKNFVDKLGCRYPTLGEYLSKVIVPEWVESAKPYTERPSWISGPQGIRVQSSTGQMRLTHATRAMVSTPVFTVEQGRYPTLKEKILHTDHNRTIPFALTGMRVVTANSFSAAGTVKSFLASAGGRLDDLPLLHELIGFLKSAAAWNSTQRSIWFSGKLVPAVVIPYVSPASSSVKFAHVDYHANTARLNVVDDTWVKDNHNLAVSMLTVARNGSC